MSKLSIWTIAEHGMKNIEKPMSMAIWVKSTRIKSVALKNIEIWPSYGQIMSKIRPCARFHAPCLLGP